MKVTHYRDTASNEEVPRVFKRDVIAPEDGAPRFCMRIFEVKPGSSTRFMPTGGNMKSIFSPDRVKPSARTGARKSPRAVLSSFLPRRSIASLIQVKSSSVLSA